MAAHKDQSQRVILMAFILNSRCRHLITGLKGRFGFAPPAGRFTSQVVGYAPRRNLNQPAARVIRNAFARPLDGCCQQRFLNRILGSGEVMEAADNGTEHLGRELA